MSMGLQRLEPFIAEEHKQVLEEAEQALEHYSERLIDIIKREFLVRGLNSKPEDLVKAERAFQDDPIRNLMVRRLWEFRRLVEQPRFKVSSTQYAKHIADSLLKQ